MTSEGRRLKAFRGDIQKLYLATGHFGDDVIDASLLHAGVDCCSSHAALQQSVHLVAHQGDQGRHNKRDMRQLQGRNLIAEGLAATGGHHGHDVLSVQDSTDGFGLSRPKRIVPEGLVQLAPCALDGKFRGHEGYLGRPRTQRSGGDDTANHEGRGRSKA